MKITKKITIEKSTDIVWKVFADDFANAYKWMSGVTHSYQTNSIVNTTGAPVSGRVCKLDNKDDSMYVVEKIINYDKSNLDFKFQVTPENAPTLMPVKRMNHHVSLRSLGPNKTEVIWNATPDLKLHGKIMKPMLKIGFGKFFKQILVELKHFTEKGTPHPKKIKFDLKNAQPSVS